jgi:hypothetical protein
LQFRTPRDRSNPLRNATLLASIGFFAIGQCLLWRTFALLG